MDPIDGFKLLTSCRCQPLILMYHSSFAIESCSKSGNAMCRAMPMLTVPFSVPLFNDASFQSLYQIHPYLTLKVHSLPTSSTEDNRHSLRVRRGDIPFQIHPLYAAVPISSSSTGTSYTNKHLHPSS